MGDITSVFTTADGKKNNILGSSLFELAPPMPVAPQAQTHAYDHICIWHTLCILYLQYVHPDFRLVVTGRQV